MTNTEKITREHSEAVIDRMILTAANRIARRVALNGRESLGKGMSVENLPVNRVYDNSDRRESVVIGQ